MNTALVATGIVALGIALVGSLVLVSKRLGGATAERDAERAGKDETDEALRRRNRVPLVRRTLDQLVRALGGRPPSERD